MGGRIPVSLISFHQPAPVNSWGCVPQPATAVLEVAEELLARWPLDVATKVEHFGRSQTPPKMLGAIVSVTLVAVRSDGGQRLYSIAGAIVSEDRLVEARALERARAKACNGWPNAAEFIGQVRLNVVVESFKLPVLTP